MTAKTPEPPQESRPGSAASSTSSVPAQPAAAAPAAPPARPPAAAAKTAARPAPAPKSRNGSNAAAFVVAICALLVAVGATAVAIYSLSVARDAISRTADSGSQPAPVAPSATQAAAAPGGSPSPTAARIQFVPEFVRTELRLVPSDPCASVYVDVDTMAKGVDAFHEFYLSSCTGSPFVRVDRASGAAPTSPNPSPELCAAQLAGTSTPLVLAVRTGLTFCLLTHKADATQQSIPQRIAIVDVREIGADQSVTIAVSTYRVPTT